MQRACWHLRGSLRGPGKPTGEYDRGPAGKAPPPPSGAPLLVFQRRSSDSIWWSQATHLAGSRDPLDRAAANSGTAWQSCESQDGQAQPGNRQGHAFFQINWIKGCSQCSPPAVARAMPALTRSRTLSARTRRTRPSSVTWPCRRRRGVDALLVQKQIDARACSSERKPQRSCSERPRRSTDHAITTSNRRRAASLCMASKPGR